MVAKLIQSMAKNIRCSHPWNECQKAFNRFPIKGNLEKK